MNSCQGAGLGSFKRNSGAAILHPSTAKTLFARQQTAKVGHSQRKFVGSLHSASQRGDKGIKIALKHVNVWRNPQTLDVLDLAVFHVDLVFLAKVALELLHVDAVDRKQTYRSEAVPCRSAYGA